MRSKIIALSKNEEFKTLLKKKKISNQYVTIFYGNLENKNIQFGETTTLRNIATKDELNVSCDKGVFAFIY